MTTRSARQHQSFPRVAVVVSRYNATVTDKLLRGALTVFSQRVGLGEPVVIEAPGAFELPALALFAARQGCDAVVALGCLIRGQTIHDRVIADAVAQGLVNVTIVTGVPITFGILTVNTPRQALARAGGKEGNKGADAMNAALDVLAETARLEGAMKGAERVVRSSKRSTGPTATLSSRVRSKDKLARSPRR
jgi:6,7-dimethyl-8-ribityllumazine synthase